MADLPLGWVESSRLLLGRGGSDDTKYLSEYGATVLRVESAKRPGDPATGRPVCRGRVRHQPVGLFRELQRQQVRPVHRYGPSERARVDPAHRRVGGRHHRKLSRPVPSSAGVWGTRSCARPTRGSCCSARRCWAGAGRCRRSPGSGRCCRRWPATLTSLAGRTVGR